MAATSLVAAISAAALVTARAAPRPTAVDIPLCRPCPMARFGSQRLRQTAFPIRGRQEVAVRSLASMAGPRWRGGLQGPRSLAEVEPMLVRVGGVRGIRVGKGSKRQYDYGDVVRLIAEPSPKRMLIDVRTPEEVAATGRIPGARNVSITAHPHAFHLDPAEFEDVFGFRLPADKAGDEVIFYCKAGVRSRAACGLAQEAGWKKVGEYGGSWVDWEANGGEVEWGQGAEGGAKGGGT